MTAELELLNRTVEAAKAASQAAEDWKSVAETRGQQVDQLIAMVRESNDNFDKSFGILTDYKTRIEKTLKFISENGGINSTKDPRWLLDQVVRILLANEYESWMWLPTTAGAKPN